MFPVLKTWKVMPAFEYKFPNAWGAGQKKENNRHCIGLVGALNGPPMPPVHPEFNAKMEKNAKLKKLSKKTQFNGNSETQKVKDIKESTFIGWLSSVLDNDTNRKIIEGEWVFNAKQRNLLSGEKNYLGLLTPVSQLDKKFKACYKEQFTWGSQTLMCQMEMYLHKNDNLYIPSWYLKRPEKKESNRRARKNFKTLLSSVLEAEFVAISGIRDLASLDAYVNFWNKTMKTLFGLFFNKNTLNVNGPNANFLLLNDIRALLHTPAFKARYNQLAPVGAGIDTKKGSGSKGSWNLAFDYDPSHRMRKDALAGKKQADAVTAPTPMHESDLWRFVSELCKIVFKDQNWDGVTIKESDGNYRSRMGAAISLIQLCIGSRNAGILCTNEITPVEFESGKNIMDDDSDVLQKVIAPSKHLLLVNKISKQRNSDYQVGRFMSQYAEQIESGALTQKEAFKLATKQAQDKRDNKKVVRPFQFYFLDPSNFPDWAGSEKWKEKDRAKREPRTVFLNLLSVVRGRIYAGLPANEKKNWTFYKVSITGRKQQLSIWRLMDDKNLKESSATQWYKACETVIKGLTEEPQKLLPSKMDSDKVWGTHDMRRLYVCYAYLMFAASYMKEIAFARKMLAHDSFDVSMSYTNIHIDQTIKSVVEKDGAASAVLSGEIATKVDKLIRKFDEITGKLDECGGACGVDFDVGDVGKNKFRRRTEIFERLDGSGGVEIDVLRSMRGMKVDREVLLSRAKKKIEELVDAEVYITSRKLKAVGISSVILPDARRYLDQITSE